MEERRKAGRLIIFVAGGMTYSEMRVIHEMCSSLKKDVIIGASETFYIV
jgi:syntaxin-binding protein 1